MWSSDVMWFDVMHRELAATWWQSSAAHPAEWAFEDSLLHLYWYQAGHEAGEGVVNDRREGRLVKEQRKGSK